MIAGFRPLTSLEEAQNLLFDSCSPVEAIILPLLDAVDRTVAEDVAAGVSLPKSNIALREGWAVRARDTYGATSLAPNYLPFMPSFVALGETLPENADALLPDFGLNSSNGMAEILLAAAPGESIRRAGEDLEETDVIVSAGEKLTGRQALILRLAEIDEVPVFLPRVEIFIGETSGDCFFIAEWLGKSLRAEGTDTAIVTYPAKTQALIEAFTQAASDLMIVLIDREDHSEALAIRALSEAGLILAQGLAVRPGEAISCGLLPKLTGPIPIPVILAPPRLENVLAAWLLLIRPCLDRMMNKGSERPGGVLTLSRKIASSLGRSDLVLLRIGDKDGKKVFEPLGVGDVNWGAIAKATHWLLVPPQSEGYARGEEVYGEYF